MKTGKATLPDDSILFFKSAVGRDEAVIREYVRKQEQEDQRLDQMNQW